MALDINRRQFGSALLGLGALAATGSTLAGCSGAPRPSSSSRRLKFSAVTDPTGAEAFYREQLAKFKDSNSGIDVDLVMQPAVQYPNSLQLSHRSNELPDVMRLTPANSLDRTAMTSGWLLSLEPYKDEIAGWFDAEATAPETSNLRVGSTMYAVPFTGRSVPVNMLIYNKDLFDKYGVDVPGTYSEFLAAAAHITKAGKGKVFGFADMGKQPGAGGTVRALQASAGPLCISVIGVDYRTGKAATADASLVNAIDVMRTMNAKKTLTTGWQSWGPQQMLTAFAAEQLAMMITTVYPINEVLKANPKLNVGVAPPPIPDDGRKAYYPAQPATPYWAISAKTKHPDDALALVKFLASAEHQKAYFKEFQLPTISTDVWLPLASAPVAAANKVTTQIQKKAPAPELRPAAANELVNRILTKNGSPWQVPGVQSILRNTDYPGAKIDAKTDAAINSVISQMNAEGKFGKISRDLLTFPNYDPMSDYQS